MEDDNHSLRSDDSSINEGTSDSLSETNDTVFEPDSITGERVVAPRILTPDNSTTKIVYGESVDGKISDKPKLSLTNKLMQSVGYRTNFGFGSNPRISSTSENNIISSAPCNHITQSGGWIDSSIAPIDCLFPVSTGIYESDISTRSFDSIIDARNDILHDSVAFAVVASPVPDPVQERKKNHCSRKILLAVFVPAIFITMGLFVYLYSKDFFAEESKFPSISPSILYSPPPSEIQILSQSPTISPSFSSSNRPSYIISQIPSSANTERPTEDAVTSPSPAPTKGCQPWCIDHEAPWWDDDPTANQKCRWPINCGGCQQCQLKPTSAPNLGGMSCFAWCENHEAPWWDDDPNESQKCKWIDTCAGCSQCSVHLLNHTH